MPAVVRPVVTMETLVVPDIVLGAVGVAVSQLPLDVAVAVYASPEVPVMVSVCDAGAVPPML